MTIEYAVDSGHISLVTGGDEDIPAFWAHPRSGMYFPSIGLFHDWWGLRQATRSLAIQLARRGYYVVVPDLFQGDTAQDPSMALQLLQQHRDRLLGIARTTLDAIETHHLTTGRTAAIGIGMGGNLVLDMGMRMDNIEALVTCHALPQPYIGHFDAMKAPLLMIQGQRDHMVEPETMEQLQDELDGDHRRLALLSSAGHQFFFDNPHDEQLKLSRVTILLMQRFLRQYMVAPQDTWSRRI